MSIEQIKDHQTYKEVIADSFGGVMYNMANLEKYQGKKQVLALWYSLTPSEQNAAGGIMKGAMNFLKEGIEE